MKASVPAIWFMLRSTTLKDFFCFSWIKESLLKPSLVRVVKIKLLAFRRVIYMREMSWKRKGEGGISLKSLWIIFSDWGGVISNWNDNGCKKREAVKSYTMWGGNEVSASCVPCVSLVSLVCLVYLANACKEVRWPYHRYACSFYIQTKKIWWYCLPYPSSYVHWTLPRS